MPRAECCDRVYNKEVKKRTLAVRLYKKRGGLHKKLHKKPGWLYKKLHKKT